MTKIIIRKIEETINEEKAQRERMKEQAGKVGKRLKGVSLSWKLIIKLGFKLLSKDNCHFIIY